MMNVNSEPPQVSKGQLLPYTHTSNISFSAPMVDGDLLRKNLRDSLKKGKAIMIAKPDRYRGVGKTSMIVNYLTFVESSCVIVPTEEMKDTYLREGISKDRIISAYGLTNIMGFTKLKHFVMDEIKYHQYLDIRNMVYPIKDATLSGIVAVYDDYITL